MLGYLEKNWDKLTVYLEDGALAIDNNAAENAIRPFVMVARTGCSAIPPEVPTPVRRYTV